MLGRISYVCRKFLTVRSFQLPLNTVSAFNAAVKQRSKVDDLPQNANRKRDHPQ